MQGQESLDQAFCQNVAHGGRHAEDDTAAHATGGFRDVGARLLHLAQDGAGPAAQHLAFRGQHHAAAMAAEQGNLQLLLQQRDLAAERRLGSAQLFRSPRQAAEFGHGDEGIELPQIHEAIQS